MKKMYMALLLLAAGGIGTKAQTGFTLTLQQCIDSALKNNLQIRQSKLSAEASKVNLNQARANRQPTLVGNVNQGVNLGRNVDPFTNDYVNQTINYGLYGISSNVILFDGFGLRNNIRQSEAAHDADNMELRLSMQNARLNAILAYLRVLSSEEQLRQARAQAELSEKHVRRMELLNKKGTIRPSQLSDLKGQLLNDQLAIVDLQNQVEWYKMELAQVMNIPYSKEMQLQKINVDEMLAVYPVKASDVYRRALLEFPQIKASALRTKSADYALKSAKGLRYPTVFLGTTIGTAFTSTAETVKGRIGFSNQFINNTAINFNLGIRIPIFTANSVKSQIKLAEITVQNNALAEERTKYTVWQEIERAHVGMSNAYQRYLTLQNQLNAYKQSFKAAEARFVTGLDTSIDYLMARNNLDRANINFITAKYDFILRKKVLEYYQTAQ